MLAIFSPLGKWLDKTYVNLSGRQRFADTNKYMSKSLGALGLAFLCCCFLALATVWVWWSATHPPPAHFFLNNAPSYLVRADAKADREAGTALVGSTQTQREIINSGGQNVVAQPPTAIELITSRSPQMSFERVQSWVSRSLMDIYTLDFQNYRQQLETSRLLFRKDTYDLFIQQMNMNILPSLVKNRMLLTMTPTSSVRLIQPAEYDGRRFWLLEMKGLLYYDGAFVKKPAPQEILFTVVVEEVPSSTTPYGLVISTIEVN